MKLHKINNACKALEHMLKLQLPYPTIREMLRLRNLLRPEAEMYAQEEEKLIYQYGKKHKNGTPEIQNGRIKFDSTEQMEKYKDQINKLRSMEIDLPLSLIKITEKEIGQQLISMECIDNLEGFIEFGGD